MEFTVLSAVRADKERVAQNFERERQDEENKMSTTERVLQERKRQKQEANRACKDYKHIQVEKERELKELDGELEQKEKDFQLRFDVMTWVSRLDTLDEYMNTLAKHAQNPESYIWILKTQEYKKWY